MSLDYVVSSSPAWTTTVKLCFRERDREIERWREGEMEREREKRRETENLCNFSYILNNISVFHSPFSQNNQRKTK